MKPVAWGMLDKDGGIYDTICPEEHDREEGAYTIPLYTHPAKTEDEGKVCARCGAIAYDPVIAQTAKTLTDEEIVSLINKHIDYVPDGDGMKVVGVMDLCRAILKKASEK